MYGVRNKRNAPGILARIPRAEAGSNPATFLPRCYQAYGAFRLPLTDERKFHGTDPVGSKVRTRRRRPGVGRARRDVRGCRPGRVQLVPVDPDDRRPHSPRGVDRAPSDERPGGPRPDPPGRPDLSPHHPGQPAPGRLRPAGTAVVLPRRQAVRRRRRRAVGEHLACRARQGPPDAGRSPRPRTCPRAQATRRKGPGFWGVCGTPQAWGVRGTPPGVSHRHPQGCPRDTQPSP